VPGQGYQFSAEVKSPTELANIAPGPIEVQEEIVVQRIRERSTVVTEEIIHETPALPAPPSTPPWKIAAVSSVSAIVLAALGIWSWHAAHHPASADASAHLARANRRSIAVLGFRNLSGRSEEGWLSTAIAEMLRHRTGGGRKVAPGFW
jgi:eukaryotic-like serine/threonine-protein kinase